MSIYPTIAATVGLPDHLRTPLDFLKFEAEGFIADHRGDDVIPRKFLKQEEGHVIVEAISPDYSCALIEGVYDGILQLCGVKGGQVRQTKCVRRGDPVCEYDIKWNVGSGPKPA